jgi:exopolysaccharide biosynthesis protein
MVLLGPVLGYVLQRPAHAQDVTCERRQIAIGTQSREVSVVVVPPRGLRLAVALADGRVGATAELATLAYQYSATAALNGSYFSAYTSSSVKPPWNTLITGGRVCAISDVGTVLGFRDRNEWRMDRLTIRFRGRVMGNKSWLAWYATKVNVPLSPNAAHWFDRYYVGSTTPSGGIQVVVSRQTVRRIGQGPVPIPMDGYVLVFTGRESYQARRFSPGARCQIRVDFGSSEERFWSQASEAIGAGPRLLRSGQSCVSPEAEGFRQSKVVFGTGARGVIGVRQDGTVVLTVLPGTLSQAARAMQALGAVDAMCMDGGASAGLWCRGAYEVRPGRHLSNAWVVVPDARRGNQYLFRSP